MINTGFIPGVLCITAGIVTIILRFYKIKWFNNLYRIREMEGVFGKKGTNIVCVISACIFFILGIWLIFIY